MKIGVLLDSFRKPFKESVKAASALGVSGVQIYANGGAIYDGMPVHEIKEVNAVLAGEGINVSALCADFGSRMFYFPNEMRPEIERQKRILALAQEFGTKIATTHIGVVPEDFNTQEFESMHSVCRELAVFADSIGGNFAVETGPEPAQRLKRFLDTLQSKGVGVNFDPANLVMVIGENPAETVHFLKDYIVHTHAKDGKMLKKGDPRALYIPAVSHLDPLDFSDYIAEVPLGEGEVPWDDYIAALKSFGYDGYLTIEREVGETPERDIALAVDFLRKYI